jgi:hypothetical protein
MFSFSTVSFLGKLYYQYHDQFSVEIFYNRKRQQQPVAGPRKHDEDIWFGK